MLADPRAEVLVYELRGGLARRRRSRGRAARHAALPRVQRRLARRISPRRCGCSLKSVLLEERNVQALLTADYTFVNERLARHYGIDGVVGPQFRRVELDGSRAPRAARQGRACCSARRTATARRRCCAARGCSTSSWARRRLRRRPASRRTRARPRASSRRRCASGSSSTARTRAATRATASSTRTAWRSRISRPSGQWRDFDKDAGAPIDPRSELLGRRGPSTGPVALREALLERDDQFVQALTEKLMMYAVGRELEYYDMPQVRAVVRAAKDEDYRFSALVAGIVQSDAFRMQACRRPDGRREASRERPAAVGEYAMFLTKKHLSRRTVLKAAGVSLELAAARRDDPRAHGARADGGRAEAARRDSSISRTARSCGTRRTARRSTRGRRAAPAPISS